MSSLNTSKRRKRAIGRVRALIADAKTFRRANAFLERLSRIGATVLLHEKEIFGSYSKAKKLPKDWR